jgi:hypothetical protein
VLPRGCGPSQDDGRRRGRGAFRGLGHLRKITVPMGFGDLLPANWSRRYESWLG